MQDEHTQPTDESPEAAGPAPASESEALHPQVVEDPEEEERTAVSEPARLLRVAAMTRAMLEEVRQADLDAAGRHRLLQIYESSMGQLKDSLSEDLVEELDDMFGPLGGDATGPELRIVQAQLVGWLEGLFHGIQASIFSQQAAAAAQLDEMRRRRMLESGTEGRGQYL